MTDLRTESVVRLAPPRRPEGVTPVRPQPPAPSPPPDGVELGRLTRMARLTPAQALEVGAQVIEKAASPAAPADASTRTVVGADGRVSLVHSPTGPGVAAELAALAAAARSRTSAADRDVDGLLAPLDLAATQLPVVGVPGVAAALRAAADAGDRRAVRAELGALVRAVGASAGGASGIAPARTGPRDRTPAGRGRGGRRRTAARRVGAWILSLLVLGSVVAVEVVLLRDDIAEDIGLLLDAGRSGASPSVADGPEEPPVEPPAPPAAGRVTGVGLRPLAPCAPGALCTVRVQVLLAPSAEPAVATWTYRIVDRCSGAAQTVAGGSVAVPALGVRAEAVTTVVLPPAPALAVVAVTELPAVAASSALPVGSCAPVRPAG